MHTYLQFLYENIKELIFKLVILVRPNFIFKEKKMMLLLFHVNASTVSTTISSANVLISGKDFY